MSSVRIMSHHHFNENMSFSDSFSQVLIYVLTLSFKASDEFSGMIIFVSI